MQAIEPLDPLTRLFRVLFLAVNGGVIYFAVEVFWRGWSHWTMAMCGAIGMVIFDAFDRRFPHLSLPFRALFGAAVITTMEVIVGSIVNLRLHMGVWDYTDMPFHWRGQICPTYSFLWFLLCIPIFLFCRVIRRGVFEETDG